MKRSARLGKVKVTADGEGVVSHAGAELLREMAGFSGLIDAWDRALISTYGAMPIHFPGTVLADLAVAIADGADSISDLKSLRDQPVLFGPVASTSTAWRVLDRVSEAHLSKLRAGRATARALFRSWPCRRNSSLVDLKRAFALVFALVCRIQLVPVASGWLLDLFADLRKLPVGALPAPSFPVPGLIMSPLL